MLLLTEVVHMRMMMSVQKKIRYNFFCPLHKNAIFSVEKTDVQPALGRCAEMPPKALNHESKPLLLTY